MSKHYKGEKGTVITLDAGIDISNGSSFKIEVEKPDGTKVSWTGALSNTRYITYTLQTGDFDQTGNYKIQSHIVAPNGEWYGETIAIYVNEYFE
jgi:hypothetical protein